MKAGLVASVVAALVMFTAVPTQAQEEMEPVNSGAWSFELGSDVATAYWFRGISQGSINRQGVIIQPFMNAAVLLWEDDEWSIAGDIGTWNSFTAGQRGGGWYESDLSAGVTVGTPSPVTVRVAYVLFQGPNAGVEYQQEIGITATYDDADGWEDLGVSAAGFAGLQPYVLLVFDTSGAADGFGGSGIYLELGVNPQVLVCDNQDFPVTLTVPVILGLSLNDYYQTAATVSSDTFGYGSVGVDLSAPLASIVPARFGAWTAHVGVEALFLSRDLQTISAASAGTGTGTDNVQVIARAGASMSY
jgi:hypothetical protein